VKQRGGALGAQLGGVRSSVVDYVISLRDDKNVQKCVYSVTANTGGSTNSSYRHGIGSTNSSYRHGIGVFSGIRTFSGTTQRPQDTTSSAFTQRHHTDGVTRFFVAVRSAQQLSEQPNEGFRRRLFYSAMELVAFRAKNERFEFERNTSVLEMCK
jgi:hypothetical protein